MRRKIVILLARDVVTTLLCVSSGATGALCERLDSPQWQQGGLITTSRANEIKADSETPGVVWSPTAFS